MEAKMISLLYPYGTLEDYKTVSDVTMHDLGMDHFLENVAGKEQERNMIMKVLSKMTKDPKVAEYRLEIFKDIYSNPDMCDDMMKLLDKINFLREYGSFKKRYDETAGLWELMHRLEEINDYIGYVEAIYRCLENADIGSQGLSSLKKYVDEIYHDNGFEALKKDIADMKVKTSELKSVTVGINLNERFEASSIGLVSVNNQYFTKSGIISGFCEKISSKDAVKNGTEWKENYKYHPFSEADSGVHKAIDKAGKMNLTISHFAMSAMLASVPDKDSTTDVPHYMNQITGHMLSQTVKKLRELLDRYVSITITDITNLIPEFIYYIRFADYIRRLEEKGFRFCQAQVLKTGETGSDSYTASAQGLYNLKLTGNQTEENFEIVTNDFQFDKEHLVYILTGANRGGKTTITQAIGQLFVLAQGGIFVPAESFRFYPVDCIFTHFPADEDKTVDLGRLGEECKRFKELFFASTKDSLILLNETFSTTSFEEGYYIAKDSVRAILKKGVRTLYNTHMHKLAFDIGSMNQENVEGKAVSLIVRSEAGKRLFKVEIAQPEGMSYARDIAEKYGVTYEMLTTHEM